MIAIIDYDAGNIKSVEKAFVSLGAEVVITRDANEILKADKVVLPGVGSFGNAMSKLESYHLIPIIKQVIDNGIPFLGICLGLQLLFEKSEESIGVKGLGILKGEIIRIPDNGELKVPHMGWNSLCFPKKSILFKGIKEDSYVYFIHSFYLRAAEESIVIGTTEYNVLVHCAIEHNNIFACQFHPEKSSDVGMAILRNFISVNQKGR